MGKKLSDAPIYFAILQVKFNPIYSLDVYSPQIQDDFRKSGFPDAQRHIFNVINLGQFAPSEQNFSQIPLTPTSSYVFCDLNRQSGFVLNQDAITYQVSNYDVFDSFVNTFLEGLKIVNQAVGSLSYIDRIGLRYLDAVVPEVGHDLGLYMNSFVLGHYINNKDFLVQSFNESILNREGIDLTARTIIRNGPVGFPPDLAQHGLELPEKFSNVNCLHAMLDTDGSMSSRMEFDYVSLKSKITKIHDQTSKIFKETVTSSALEGWL